MEDKYDLQLINYFGEWFNYKRFFLPTSIMLPLMLISNNFQNDFYIFFSTFISISILGWNFPSFTKLYYSRPIYFEDLDDDKSDKNFDISVENIESSEQSSDKDLAETSDDETTIQKDLKPQAEIN